MVAELAVERQGLIAETKRGGDSEIGNRAIAFFEGCTHRSVRATSVMGSL